MSKPKVLMIVTLDTKAVEAKFVRETLEANGVDVVHLDASIRSEVEGGAQITPTQVAAAAGKTTSAVAAFRDRLIGEGLVYAPRYGWVELAIPHFDDYVRRTLPPLGPRRPGGRR